MKGSRHFNITTGVKQGDALLAVIFNLALNSVVSKVDRADRMLIRMKQVTAYADDIAVRARNKNVFKEIFLEL